MPQIPLVQALRLLVTVPWQRLTKPVDGIPVEFEVAGLAAQLLPEVYRPLSTALGARSLKHA